MRIFRRFPVWLLLPFFFSLQLNVVQGDDELKQTAIDKQVSIIIASLIGGDEDTNLHLLRRKLDNEISRRAMKQFLKTLDPGKFYFYQSDFEEFTKEEDNLDEKLQSGDLTFAIRVYQRFMERIKERVETANKWIDADLDFTKDESFSTDYDNLNFARNPEEASERWRKKIKFDLLVLKAAKVEGDEAKEKLRKRYRLLQSRMERLKSDRILEMFANAVAKSYDPHTEYFARSSYERFQFEMSLNLEGIGATLQSEDGITVIKSIVPGGAADKEGSLKLEDRIVSVGQGDDKSGEMVDVIDMELDDVVKLIRGKKGTVVRLGVMPDGSNDVKVISITREKIQFKDREAKGAIFDQGTKPDGKPYRVGVIELPTFYLDMDALQRGDFNYKSATKDVIKIIRDFKEKNVDAVVMDLRRNGGGSLSEAIGCTGLFIDHGTVVQTKDFFGRVREYEDRSPGALWEGPLVVVTSRVSASASEILAGAVKDYKRGIVVGDKTTYGKGTVQSLINLWGHFNPSVRNPSTKWGALKITQSQFYRPGGDSTQKKGVEADVVLPSLMDHMDIGEGELFEFAVEFDKVRSAEFDSCDLVSAQTISALAGKSRERVGKSEDFKKLQTRISEYVKEKNEKKVTLNEKKFFEKEVDAEKEAEKTLDQQTDADGKIERDFYMNEVLAIAADYVAQLKKSKPVN